MKLTLKKILITTVSGLLYLLFSVYLYTLLHEGGHALVALLYGGKIDRFVLGFNAHVGTSGASFTPFGEALFHLGGALLPVTFLAFSLIFYRRNIKNLVYHSIYAIFTASVIGSLIAWVAIPVISLFTAPPARDDVTRFLDVSKLHPLIVSLTALFVIILLAFLVYKRGMILTIKERLQSMSKAEKIVLSKRKIFAVVFPILFLCTLTFFSSKLLLPGTLFQTSFTLNMQENKKVLEETFDVEKSKSYRLNLKLDAEGVLTDIQIYDNRGNTVYQNLCEWCTLDTELNLKKGTYRLVLTFLKEPEEMVRHFEEKDYGFSQDQIDMLKEIVEKSEGIQAVPIFFSANMNG